MLLDYVRELEGKSSEARRQTILHILKDMGITCLQQSYATGVNLVVPSENPRFLGVSSHFDVVKDSPGANDNASAIAVCLGLLKKYQLRKTKKFGVQFMFFDEEENGLKGSKAYIERFGIRGMLGLLNMELVGKGKQFALWPLSVEHNGKLLKMFEYQSRRLQIPASRFDKIVTNTADHRSFLKAGVKQAFTISCISPKDMEVAEHFHKALEFEVDHETLVDILSEAPIFQHYHQPTDTSQHLSEQTLKMVEKTIWETIKGLDETA